MPTVDSYLVANVTMLNKRRTPIQKQLEALLCLVGLSQNYLLGDNEYPTFLYDDDRVWLSLLNDALEEVFQDFHDTSKSSNDDTNFVDQEPFVVKQGPGSCGKGAHYGYNCPPQIPIISNPEPCYNQNLNEIPQNCMVASTMSFWSDLYQEEFTGELAHIISLLEYDHFCFKIEPKLGNLTMDVVGDIFPTREPRVHVPNVLPTHPTLHLDLDYYFLVNLSSLILYGSFFLFSRCPGCLKPLGFVLHSPRASHPQLHFGNPIS
ncbi:hypothetical protein Tco_0377076 [Tanacetum coccineum]